jgi:hypothetical protein
MLEQMDDQLSERRAKLEAMLQRLKEIESEV